METRQLEVTLVCERAPALAREAGVPELSPELLASVGARYSRSDEGLHAILSKIDPSNEEKSIDSIFNMVDYGHRSICDMADVKLFMDGVSILLVFWVWNQCPTASGQETSTRYLKFSEEDLLINGAPDDPEWRAFMGQAFTAYNTAYDLWVDYSQRFPHALRLPKELLEKAETDPKAQRQVERMRRNFAFDRARYFIPVAARTNFMLKMPSTGWVELVQKLLSVEWAEANLLGEKIKEQLGLVVPRLIKHAVPREYFRQWHRSEIFNAVNAAVVNGDVGDFERDLWLCVVLPAAVGTDLSEITEALAFHEHRYAPVGSALTRTSVSFGWREIAMAELRDLNRHRTGTRYFSPYPRGFYFAQDQAVFCAKTFSPLAELSALGLSLLEIAQSRLCERPTMSGLYWTLLGHEYFFDHTTTADKFIYEMELRTGVGAHYRYAKHCRDILEKWYEVMPQTRGLICEGSAEPE